MLEGASTTESKGLLWRRWRTLALEIGAIFIGITASFIVDEWREQRQDLETFHRILGEIYYDIRVDESMLVGMAASNNAALMYASDLVLRERELPPPGPLFEQLERIFGENPFAPTVGGFERLENTPLAIPVNDVQLSLDNAYGSYLQILEVLGLQMSELRELRRDLWSSTGVVACADPLQGIAIIPAIVVALDLAAQTSPAREAVNEDGVCLTASRNHEVSVRVMEDEAFLTGLRQVIRIRENIAGVLAYARTRTSYVRTVLEAYLPDIHLPVEELGMVGDATAASWDPTLAVDMRRAGTHEWEAEIDLVDGELKFVANHDWAMNWGAPRPWVASDFGMNFDADAATGAVFPSGRGVFNGINIPVEAGRYRVRFNTRSGDYSFQRLSD